MESNLTEHKVQCFHCGEPVYSDAYQADDHNFCCLGCQSVYSILSSANLRNYYKYNHHPGKTQNERTDRLEYLDDPKIVQKLIDFQDEEFTLVSFYIPAIHCSSCIWLLENLYKLNSAVVHARVDFVKKQVTLKFRNSGLSLRQLIELLTTIGYEPIITLQDVVKKQGALNQNTLVQKIAVAGFCFGNSMLFSLPEYFGLATFEQKYSALFAWLNLALSFPVLLYCARDYFVSAVTALKLKQVNLDVPLALGIFILFLRTAIEVVGQTGPGFADTLCGLVFFILIGKYIQNRTFYHLSFERDYRSYFPVAVTVLAEDAAEAPKPIADLQVGERILIRNNEIIPADAILLRGKASLDFSFVTGESDPVEKSLGEIIYAGGRQLGEAIELEIVKPVSQSYLTNLWNNDNFKSYDRNFKTFSNAISKYFTAVLLTIASGSALYWMLGGDAERAWGAFTAVLIIACPCALALSSPFTLSAALSIFDKNKFFVKNTAAIEQMAQVSTLVFDKTGTITSPKSEHIQFAGSLSAWERQLVASVCRNSSHPLSIQIVSWLKVKYATPNFTAFEEIAGKGIAAEVDGRLIKIGSASFTGSPSDDSAGSRVYISIDGQYKGYFAILQPWRRELKPLIGALNQNFDIHLISGDRDADREALKGTFAETKMHFNQAPKDKLNYIADVQQRNQKVCMIGDGLNDAGALRQADFGVAVSDDINSFSPGCDAILEGGAFDKLPRFFAFARSSMSIIYMCFAISLLYNAVGLFFAVQGTMSPLFAAILMPLSTVTIISFTSIASHVAARKHRLIHY